MNLEIESRVRILSPYTGWDEKLTRVLYEQGFKKLYTADCKDYYFDHNSVERNEWIRVRDHVVHGETGQEKLMLLQTKLMLDDQFDPSEKGIRVAREVCRRNLESEGPLKQFERLEDDGYQELCCVSGKRIYFASGNHGISIDNIDGRGQFVEYGMDVEIPSMNQERVLSGIKEIEMLACNLFGWLEKIGVRIKVEPRIYPEIPLEY